MSTCSLMPSPSRVPARGSRRCDGARVPSFDPAADPAAARDARELAHHRAEVERVVERRDAEGDVEASVRERQALGVGLDPQVGPARSSKTAAAEADQRVDDQVAGDVLAAERQQVLRRPALRGADLEPRSPGFRYRSSGGLEPVLGRRRARFLPSRGLGSGTGSCPRRCRSSASCQPCSFASSGHAASSRSLASRPGAVGSRRLGMPSVARSSGRTSRRASRPRACRGTPGRRRRQAVRVLAVDLDEALVADPEVGVDLVSTSPPARAAARRCRRQYRSSGPR